MKQILFFLLLAIFLGPVPALATTYYISYSSGSNSNNGTSKSTPWKSHPYMQSAAGCAGTLPTYSHTAGDNFIFKQGDSWPNACFDMVIAAGGTSSIVQDSYTYDPTWGVPGGTTGNLGQRVGAYQFTAGGSVINGSDTLNNFIYDAGSNNYILFNGVEFTGQTWTGSNAVYGANITTSTYITFTNIYAHGWTHSGATADTMQVIAGNGTTPFNVGASVLSSLIDGTNSGGSGISNSGAAIVNISDVNNTIVKNVTRGVLTNIGGLAYNDTIGPVNASFDGTVTTACLEAYSMVSGGFSLVYFYNNVIHDCTGIGIMTQAAAANDGREFDYLWDNVIYAGAVGSPPVLVQFNSNSTETNGSQVAAWNNTIYAGTSAVCMETINQGNGNFETLDIENNHCISDVGLITLNITGSTYTPVTNVLMGTATAALQGYTATQQYAYSPTSATSGTVLVGTNLSAFEFLYPSAYPISSLANDTTYGGIRQTVLRPPVSAWDVGAYQFVIFLNGTYYVDNCKTVGNDNNNGSSPSTPWLTVGKVNYSAFNPGASILFRNGCLWRERLQTPSSGASGNPITFGSYGTGSTATISGATLLTGWITGTPTVVSFEASTAADNSYDDGSFLEENTSTLGVSDSNSNTYSTGTRFENITLARGTTLFSAVWNGYVFLGDTINTTMYGENVDNSAAFPTDGSTVRCNTPNPQCPNGRTKTSQNVAWATSFSGGYQPVTVTSIVQAILNRTGWVSGNALTMLTSSPGPSVPLLGRIFTNSFNTGATLTLTYVTPTPNVYAIPFQWADMFDQAGPLYFDGVEVNQSVASLGALSANNQWYYDYANLAPFLYIYSTTDPSTRTIELAGPQGTTLNPYPAAIFIQSRAWITVQNLKVERARSFNLEINGSQNIVATNVESTQSGSIGENVEGDSTNVTISGGSIHDNGGGAGDNDGIGVGGHATIGNTPVTIQYVDIYNNANDGIETYSPSPSTTALVTIQYNYIHNNGVCNPSVPSVICAGHGVQVDGPGSQAPVIQANLIVNNLGIGIIDQVDSSGTLTMLAFNNTIANNAEDCLFATRGSWTFKNNLCLNNATTSGWYEGYVNTTVSSFTSDYNDFYHAAGGNFMYWQGTATTFSGWQSASGQDSHSLSTNPFVFGNGIFILQPFSPLINAGTNLGATYQNALLPTSMWPNGVVLGNQNSFGSGWEIGAYIWNGSAATQNGLSVGGSMLP